MFQEGTRFMHDIIEVIAIFPEEKYDGFLRSAASRPRRENTNAGIDRLVMSFNGKT